MGSAANDGSRMKTVKAKTEEHRLNKFVWANVGQLKNRDKLAIETKKPAQFTRRRLHQLQGAQRWLELSAI